MSVILLLPSTRDSDAAILASALRVDGFEVVISPTLADARQVLGSQNVALMIVDLMMRNEAGTGGLDLVRELRDSYPTTRVVLTSSYHLSERQLARADCGVSGFIPRPYDLSEVVEFVRAKVASPPSSRRMWSAEPASGVSSRSLEDIESERELATRRN